MMEKKTPKSPVISEAKQILIGRLNSHVMNAYNDRQKQLKHLELICKNDLPITIDVPSGLMPLYKKINELADMKKGNGVSNEIFNEVYNDSLGITREELYEVIKRIVRAKVMKEYEKRIEEILSKGIRIISRKDDDGVEREYFGFPVDMDFNTRRGNIIGSYKNDQYTKLCFESFEIDQSKRQEKKLQKKEACRAIYRAYRDLIKKHKKSVPYKNLIESIQDDIESGKLPNSSIKKPRHDKKERCSPNGCIVPAFSTIKRIVYEPSFK